LRVENDAATLILYDIYADSAAFDAHRSTPHYRQWRDFADNNLDAPVQPRTQAY
jgi:quinol monooxygenase YgiN